jgi:hypothetical protein
MQQPTTPRAPEAPTPARAPEPAQPAVPARGGNAAVEALYRQRGEITNQLEALAKRREDLVDQAEELRPDQRGGHTERIRVIDQRSATLERSLYQIDDQVARALRSEAGEAGVSSGGSGRGGEVLGVAPRDELMDEVRRAARNGGEDGAVSALAGTGTFLFFAFLIYQGVRRWIWKRKPAPAVGSGSFDAQQIAQLQRSLDVVAVEVERIAEAQRYTAKMLNDRVLGAGEAQPVNARGVNADPVERR